MDALYGTGVTSEELRGLDRDAIVEEFLDDAVDAYGEREKEIEGLNEGLMRELERYIVLQVVDLRWREHLENMDYMREGIHLRGMAQKDPLVEYRNEGHIMFLELNDSIRTEVISLLFHMPVEVVPADDDGMSGAPPPGRAATAAGRTGTSPTSTARSPAPRRSRPPVRAPERSEPRSRWTATAAPAQQTVVKSDHENIGRNDPCWCGSGKKFKRCHGA